MAKELGVSRPTYIQIEKGERELTVSEAQKLAALFDMTLEEFLSGAIKKEANVKFNKSEKGSLRIQVPADKIQKFKEILLYILAKIGARPNIGETVLYKLLYFIDFDYYEKYGKKLIGATYIKNHYGPTPVEFKKITEQMEKEKSLEKIKSRYFQYQQRKYLPLKDSDLSILTAQEKEFIDKTLERLADKNARQLSDYSHGDHPWQATPEGQIIDYNRVWDRQSPYAERDHLGSWLDAGAMDTHKNLPPLTREEYQYYMSLPEEKDETR